jgi:hypothetical protein
LQAFGEADFAIRNSVQKCTGNPAARRQKRSAACDRVLFRIAQECREKPNKPNHCQSFWSGHEPNSGSRNFSEFFTEAVFCRRKPEFFVPSRNLIQRGTKARRHLGTKGEVPFLLRIAASTSQGSPATSGRSTTISHKTFGAERARPTNETRRNKSQQKATNAGRFSVVKEQAHWGRGMSCDRTIA